MCSRASEFANLSICEFPLVVPVAAMRTSKRSRAKADSVGAKCWVSTRPHYRCTLVSQRMSTPIVAESLSDGMYFGADAINLWASFFPKASRIMRWLVSPADARRTSDRLGEPDREHQSEET